MSHCLANKNTSIDIDSQRVSTDILPFQHLYYCYFFTEIIQFVFGRFFFSKSKSNLNLTSMINYKASELLTVIIISFFSFQLQTLSSRVRIISALIWVLDRSTSNTEAEKFNSWNIFFLVLLYLAVFFLLFSYVFDCNATNEWSQYSVTSYSWSARQMTSEQWRKKKTETQINNFHGITIFYLVCSAMLRYWDACPEGKLTLVH